MFLCNDLLYNSCAEVPNASSYRTKFESKLAGIVINLKATYDEIKTHAAKEKFKIQVLGCLRAWRDWNVYSADYLLQLDVIFIGAKEKEPDPDEVDGLPLDVDGVPLSKDVDGVPLDDHPISKSSSKRPKKSKFDSCSDTDDIFASENAANSSGPQPGQKPASKWEKAPPLGSKWETSPSLGSKWETSNWESADNKKKKQKSPVAVNSPGSSSFVEDDEKRRKKREIEVKVTEYIDKLESGKCTRIKQITTTDQSEMYRWLLYKGRDAKKTIKLVATGKKSLSEIQKEMETCAVSSPILKHKKSKKSASSALVSYGSSPSPSRSPSPEKRKREPSDKKKRALSPIKHDKKKKSRH